MPAYVPVTNLGAGKILHPHSCIPIYKKDKFVFTYFVRSLLLNISPWCLLSLIVSQSIWAAKTKYHSVSSLYNKHLFHTILEAGKFKMKVPAHLGLGGVCFLDCTQITFCSILTWQREHSGLSSCSYKGTNPVMGAPTLMTSSDHNHLPEAPPLKPSLQGG